MLLLLVMNLENSYRHADYFYVRIHTFCNSRYAASVSADLYASALMKFTPGRKAKIFLHFGNSFWRMHLVTSKNGVSIRLTDERWTHITTGHHEVADYLFEILATFENPEVIYEGNEKGLIAVKSFPELSDKFVAVIYKEVSADDGFVITAFVSNKKQEFEKKKVLWKLSS